MNKIILAIFSLALLSIAGCSSGGSNAAPSGYGAQQATPVVGGTETVATQPATSSITIQNFAFNPNTLTVKVGTTVTWTNNDPYPHKIASDSGNELGSDALSNGQTYSHTFNTAGTYPYHCAIHTSMKGTIVVE